MICKVRETVKKHNMFPNGGRVITALSGGADSMSLLNALLELSEEFSIKVEAAHVNHCLRGEESERDELFVRNECKKLGVELHVLKVDAAAEAAKTGEGLEECGRRLRYSFFDSLGSDITVATAHNLNDRAETFLFNFSRGAGLNGLCSVPFVRGSIVRPLSECSRSEIEEFCRERSIEYVTDSTNLDPAFSRNRIRLNVIPELKKINPAFEEAAERCLESINEDEAFLSSLASSLVDESRRNGSFDAGVLNCSPAPVKKRAIVLILRKKLGIRADSAAVFRCEKILSSGGMTQVPGGGYVRVRKGLLEFPRQSAGGFFETVLSEGINSVNGDEIFFARFNKEDTNKLQNSHTKVLEYRLDCDTIVGNVSVRGRKNGDSFSPAGRGCTKTLKKLFNENGVPPEKRGELFVFEDDEGIIAVEGFGVDKRCAVTSKTEKAAKIIIRRGK